MDLRSLNYKGGKLTYGKIPTQPINFSSVRMPHTENIFRELLPIAKDATFDSRAEARNAQCHPSTQIEILEQIKAWAENTGHPNILWLNGMAMMGKSTISRTIAHWLNESLSASFFFKRDEQDRGHASLFFTTIVAQLVSKVPDMKPFIQEALYADPDLPGKALGVQFEKLFFQPLSKLNDFDKRYGAYSVIVVDGLDECDRDDDIREIIILLSQVNQLGWLKVFITSRPELSVRLGFNKIQGNYEEIFLSEVSPGSIHRDIARFFSYELARISEDYNGSVSQDRQLPWDWVDGGTCERLTDMAYPLLYWAATICRFVEDRRLGGPSRHLAKILQYGAESFQSTLDEVYLSVLNRLLVGLSDPEKQDMVEKFRHIVGSIVT
jgi:hypothetical protein